MDDDLAGPAWGDWDDRTSSAWGGWALCTVSSPHAFELEIGSQARVGYWDLGGFAAGGSIENSARYFQLLLLCRYQYSEIKHDGRIAILIAMEHITSEVTSKRPGLL
eukprot:13864479-Heterocapsa_arctica.AAC.1